MQNKIGVITIFIIFIISGPLYSEIDLSLNGEVQLAPWFYEPIYQLSGTSFSTAWIFGVMIDRFTPGLDLFLDYVSFDGNKEGAYLKGAFF